MCSNVPEMKHFQPNGQFYCVIPVSVVNAYDVHSIHDLSSEIIVSESAITLKTSNTESKKKFKDFE